MRHYLAAPPARRPSRASGLHRKAAFALPALALTLTSLPGCQVDDEDPAGVLERDFNMRVSPERTVCAGSSTLAGIDVSSWQGSINWSQVASSGRAFAIARIGDGSYIDPQFQTNWQQIKAVGMIRGAYQFFRAGQDPYAQANIVINAVGRLGDGDLPVTLDIEDQSVSGVSTSTVVANMNAWLAAVEAGTGKRPIIYTGYYVFDDYEPYGDYSSYPLWIAAWGVSCPSINNEWATWTFWQYSSSGSVPGIYGSVDLDVFNGNWQNLVALAGGGGSSSPRYPVVSGNWDGVGGDAVGLFNTSSAVWSLNNAVDGSTTGYQFQWGPPGSGDVVPIAGDWNGDRVATVGLWSRSSSSWGMTDYNQESGVDHSFQWGSPNDPYAVPLAGDWNGDGIDTVGIWDRDSSVWTMTDYNQESGVDHQFQWGPYNSSTAVPIVGDWNGDGIDTVGLWYRDTSVWSMTDYNQSSGVDHEFQWGPTNDPNVVPVTGDWNGDGIDTPGLYNTVTGEWGMTDYNQSSGVDHSFTWSGTISGPPDPDHDGDGWAQSKDCNDADASIHPGAPEYCNGRDDNCNGQIDDNPVDALAWWQDADGDGYGNPNAATTACGQPAGYVASTGEADCNDQDPNVSPAADEVAGDGIDNNCDGQVDENSGGCGAGQPLGSSHALPGAFLPLFLFGLIRRRR